jgi:DNA-binding PadR family transcriptional regulator
MWPNFEWARRSRHRGLRLLVLGVLAREPKNGAEIMDEIEAMSMGWWRPSPGSVYPLLEQLANEGLIQKREDGRYQLTDEGRQETGWPYWALRPELRGVDGVLGEVSNYIAYLEDLKKSKPNEVAAHTKKISELAERLSKLAG